VTTERFTQALDPVLPQRSDYPKNVGDLIATSAIWKVT
jgi:hypothetical protein